MMLGLISRDNGGLHNPLIRPDVSWDPHRFPGFKVGPKTGYNWGEITPGPILIDLIAS